MGDKKEGKMYASNTDLYLILGLLFMVYSAIATAAGV
jgi:hypothetical protein